MSKIKGVPREETAAYIAGRAIYARGPLSHEQLFLLGGFGVTSGAHDHNLKRAIDSGWLAELSPTLVGLSQRAQHYYAGTEPEPKVMGSLATPREVKSFRPMSPQYRVNSRGTRRDALDNSLAAIPSHYAKVTP